MNKNNFENINILLNTSDELYNSCANFPFKEIEKSSIYSKNRTLYIGLIHNKIDINLELPTRQQLKKKLDG